MSVALSFSFFFAFVSPASMALSLTRVAYVTSEGT